MNLYVISTTLCVLAIVKNVRANSMSQTFDIFVFDEFQNLIPLFELLLPNECLEPSLVHCRKYQNIKIGSACPSTQMDLHYQRLFARPSNAFDRLTVSRQMRQSHRSFFIRVLTNALLLP